MIYCDTDETWYVVPPHAGWEVKPVRVIKYTACFVTIRKAGILRGSSFPSRQKIEGRYFRTREEAVAQVRSSLTSKVLRATRRLEHEQSELGKFTAFENRRIGKGGVD